MWRYKPELLGLATVGGSVALTWMAGIIGLATSLLIFGVWVLKFRREWKHRNDPPVGE